MDYLSHLNAPQKEAVLHKDGPVLVVAGAGAGKTRTLVYRIHHLIKSGVAPETILAVTFTNKAANEMRERVRGLLGLEKNTFSPLTPFSPFSPFIGTFHALGIRILREKGGDIGVPKNFVIKDRDGALALIKEAMDETYCDRKQFEPRRVQNIISREKGELSSPDDYLAKKNGGYGAQKIAAVWQAYEKMLHKEKACDFDDLLVKPVLLLQLKKEARDYFRDKWRYILIDEYQDTNRAQYVLSKLLAEPRNNICAVGDHDQNIYGFRGSSIRNILQFEKDYPNTKVVLLEENYRSTAHIIRAANEIIGKNQLRIEKNLFTKNSDGEKISLFVSPDEKAEAFRVARRVLALAENSVKKEDMAVLYRANFQSRALEEAFLALEIPYQVVGTRFFERKEVKDILSFLNAARNPDSLGDIKRVINVPPRGIGKTTIAKVFSGMRAGLPQAVAARVNDFYALLARIEAASREISVADLVLFIFKESGLEAALKKEGEEGAERMMNIQELATLAKRYDTLSKEKALDTFLEDTALLSDEDSEKEKRGGVRLMTVHASKGLEFPYVFITGLEDGLFPHESFSSGGGHGGGETEAEREEEERRLFYVAVTRAAKKLFLSYAETRTVFGSRGYNMPSPFISDIPEELLELELSDNTETEKIIEI
ncbi:MAG: UvrD-helicase domain-containing protein [Parcubacteria group bacterium]|nr:UvrD-helicase domain-containing protein [Parcubacteria group bacterium]